MDMFSLTQATSFDQLWREYSPISSQMKLTTSQPSLPHSPSSELHSSKQDSELEKMRQQLHNLGYRRDQERLSSSGPIFTEAEKRAMEKEKEGLQAKIAVCKMTQIAFAFPFFVYYPFVRCF